MSDFVRSIAPSMWCLALFVAAAGVVALAGVRFRGWGRPPVKGRRRG